MKAILGFVFLGVLIPVVISAEERFPPEAGTRIRISAPRYFLFQEPAVVNESNQFDFSATLDEDGQNIRMPYFDLARMEVSRGEVRLTVIGALGGAALGGILGVATTPMPGIDEDDPFARPEGGDEFGRFMVGALIGGAVGAILGSSIQMERWEPVFSAHRRFW
jgi:hypothetical protein